MKNTALLACLAIILGLTACEEIGPKIDFGPGVQKGEDTTYKTTTVETPQQKKVLIEEFTGVSCSNCPAATTQIKQLQSGNPNILAVGYHPTNNNFTNPIEKDGVILTHYDFRTKDAEDIGNTILGGIPGMPIASIGRIFKNNSYFLQRGEWGQAVNDLLNIPTPVNISVTSVFDDASREATVVVRLAYTSSVSSKQSINMVITEDGITDAQKDGLTIVKEYEHNHVVRDVVTPINGAQIPAKVDPKEPGTVYERTFKVPISTDWKADKCHITVFITNDEAGDKTVVQAAEIKVTEP